MQVRFTTFPNQSAMRKQEYDSDLNELFTLLKSATGFDAKFNCPWVKMATFGNIRTTKNSLRHDKNVYRITGVEGDYDGEVVGIDQAISMLERAGIKAIVYTSPSHTTDKPRWRVIAPCETDHPPHIRTILIGRLNGALGGILSPESYVLSQSYYYGQVVGSEYLVCATFDDLQEGEFIDNLDELDEIAVFKKPIAHSNEDSDVAQYSLNMFELAVRHYGRLLVTGDNRRNLLKSYIASRSGKGLLRDEVVALVKTACDKYFDPADPMDEANILSMASDFAEKDKDIADQPVDLGLFLKSLGQSNPVEIKNHEEACSHKEEIKPFPGPMQAIVEASIKSSFKPQPELATLSALIAMASAINGEYSTLSGGRFNLYGIGSLPSGGGKDNPRSIAESVSGLSGAQIIGRPTSGAALEDVLVGRTNILVSVDEMSFMLEASNDPKAPAHLKDLVAVLLKLYSASRGVYNKRVRAKQQGSRSADEIMVIPNPCLSVLGFSTPEGFSSAFNESNLVDGLMGRMLFVRGRDNVRPKRPKFAQETPESLVPIVNAMTPINTVAQAAQGSSVGDVIVGETDKATELLEQLLEQCEFDRDRSVTGSSSLYARSFEKIERIAGVLAIWDDPTSPVIDVPHIQWAKSFVYQSDRNILQFVQEEMNNNSEIQDCEKIRDLIRDILSGKFKCMRNLERDAIESGCVSSSQLLRVSKMKAQQFDRALQRLQNLDEIVVFDQKGKKSKVITEIHLN